MRRVMVLCVLAAMVAQAASAAFPAPRKHPVPRGPERTVIVVSRGFPIHRPMPIVVVRPARARVAATPAVFLAPIFWNAAMASLPPRQKLCWQDSETLTPSDGWTDFTLNANSHGRQLYVQVKGWVQLNFGEVVFTNGEAQVVDFKEMDRGTGIYQMCDFPANRKISHVRIVARAKKDGSKIILRMSS